MYASTCTIKNKNKSLKMYDVKPEDKNNFETSDIKNQNNQIIDIYDGSGRQKIKSKTRRKASGLDRLCVCICLDLEVQENNT